MADSIDEETRAFARQFAELASRAHELLSADDGERVADRVLTHLRTDSSGVVTVGQTLPHVERPNLQRAVEAFVGTDDVLVGLSPELAHYGGFSVGAMLNGSFRGPTLAVPPTLDDLPIDVGVVLPCITAGIWLTKHRDLPLAIGVHAAERHGPGSAMVRVEAIATDRELARSALAELADLRRLHNVYRGKVLAFTFSEFGEFGIDFMARPTTKADDVVLPLGDLESIRQHAVAVGEHADALSAAGQHLKRGLLFHGPPGTGKTHTVGYLMAAMPERTVVVLQGPSVGALGQAAAIVRAHPPSMLVIEDVDLIATERSMHPMHGGQGLMFQLLNEMDGLGALDDVLFVLTTNRLDLLEPALAARPGRIDHAVEIGLPDEAARRRLFELYLSTVGHRVETLDEVVARSEGATGAFVKEAVRRAVTASVVAGETTVTTAHLVGAVADMLDAGSPVYAAMLGGPMAAQPSGPPMGFGHGMAPMPGHVPPGLIPPGMGPGPGFPPAVPPDAEADDVGDD